MMDRRTFLKSLGGMAASSLAVPHWACRTETEVAPRPNIIILFVDDMGFSDVGCFGGEIPTPNIDALAAGGVRMTQFYNTCRCCPSRASLLTGLYPHQAGLGLMVYRNYGEGYLGNLNDSCVTFGQLLGDAGYRTMLVGKWHAGHAVPSRPEVRGFQHSTAVYPHIDSYWKVLEGCDIYRDRRILIPAGEGPVNPYHPDQEFYTTDFFTDAALDDIDRALTTPDRPFLLHLCYNVPHFPLEAPDDLIEKHRGRYLEGWDVLRRDKIERMKAMGIVGPEQKLPRVRGFVNEQREGIDFRIAAVSDFLPDWDSLSDEERNELDFRRAIYAAQIERLDWNVGRLVRRLEERGILDNTLILFFSDNGCSGEDSTFGMNWGKYTAANYAEWRKIGGWSVSQGQVWAAYSNTPLRKYKRYVHEGGIASPFIAHWPRGIKARGGICRHQVFHLIDIVPTLCDLAGAAYPASHNGRPLPSAPGMSMRPFLQDPARSAVPRTLFWQHETCSAVRRGDWKLVTAYDRDPRSWELYDLSRDRSETENLADARPELVRGLLGAWDEWARTTGVLPYPETRGGVQPTPWPPPPWPKEDR